MSNKARNRQGNCIIFHNFSTDIEVRGLFEYIENFCNINSIVPTRIGYGTPHLPRSRSTKTFKHGKKRLYEIDFRDMEFLSIYSPQSKEDYDSLDSLISSNYSAYIIGPNDPYFSLIFDENVCPFSMNLINKLLKDLSLILKPRYGYFLKRSFD